MSPDAPHRLPQGTRPAMQVVTDSPRSVRMMRMEYDYCPLIWILRIMQVPVVAGVSGHDRHIIGVSGNDGEVFRIQTFQIFATKHEQPPFLQTMPPEPA